MASIRLDEKKTFPVPYLSRLTERIEPGQTVTIKGTYKPDGETVTINFLRDEPTVTKAVNCIFHYKMMIKAGKIVMNTLTDKEWGKEETHKASFKKDKEDDRTFDVRISIGEDKFTVYSDRKHLHDYEYRQAITTIDHLSVEGDVESISSINWGGKFYSVPYESGFGGNGTFMPGQRLVLVGKFEKKFKNFAVSFGKSNGDVSLKFEVDVKGLLGGMQVSRNAKEGGNWGNEEKEGKSPFDKDKIWDLEFRNEAYGWQVFVDDERFCSFGHRMSPEGINKLHIEGDIDIMGITCTAG